LDFNLSVILIPTLRSVQTAARHIHALDALFNEDPILFHMRVACGVGLGTLIHVIGHMNHCKAITEGPVFRPAVTPKQQLSGMTWAELILNPDNRCAGLTGFMVAYLMAAMFLSASSYVRRKTYDLSSCPKGWRDCLGWLLLFSVTVVLLTL